MAAPEKPKDPAAQALGRKRWEGVSAEERSRLMRAAVAKRKKLSPQRRRELASNASRAYWARLTPEQRSQIMKERAAKRKRGRR